MLEGVRNAMAEGKELPPRLLRFANVDLDDEEMTPHEFWLKYIVVPSTPLGRDQSAEDMGRAVVFLVSDDAKNITGQVLHVDGGITMR